MNCQHKNKEVRKMEMKNNKCHVAYQCLDCGDRIGDWLPQKGINIEGLPSWNPDIRQQYHEDQQEKTRQDFETKQLKRHKEYEKYIHSPEWKERRDRVMKRCGYLCECCLLRKAAHVHHTTYANIRNEMLWELRGVCIKCHEWIHGRRFS